MIKPAPTATASPSSTDAFRSAVARPPTRLQKASDVLFAALARTFAASILILLGTLALEVARHAGPAVAEHGLGFITSSDWDSGRGEFGVLPQIIGTLYTSILALLGGGSLGVVVALVLSQGFLPRGMEIVLKNVVELLAAIPSVIYGLWGVFVLIPAIRGPADWLHAQLGFIPLFSTELSGPGVLPASLVLAIMILPTVTAISREALAAVPPRLLAGAYALGATHWEVIFRVVLPTASGGIFGSLVLAFGRALGETMALAMLIGNANVFGWSLLSPGSTLAALLANHFPEASMIEARALMYGALVLLSITVLVNAIGSQIITRATTRLKGLS